MLHNIMPELAPSKDNVSPILISACIDRMVTALDHQDPAVRIEKLPDLLRELSKTLGSTVLVVAREKFPEAVEKALTGIARDAFEKVSAAQARLRSNLKENGIIENKLAGLLGDDNGYFINPEVSRFMKSQLSKTDLDTDFITPQQLSTQIVDEFGARGVALAASMGLPVDPELAKKHGVDYRTLQVEPLSVEEIKGFPSPNM